MRKNRINIIVVILAVLIGASVFLNSCRINYSFTGVSLSPQTKTYSVYYFPNRAQLVNPTLSQLFTEELKTKLQRKSPLKEISENGDLVFEGFIEEYESKPMSIQRGDDAAQNRLTISVKVKYTNNVDTSQSFERSFSGYKDFESSKNWNDVEREEVPVIVDQILEDIFNATIANW